MRSLPIAVTLVLSMSSLWACGKNSEPPPPTSGSPNARPESGPSRPRAAGAGQPGGASQAEQMFGSMCAMCHGSDGTGRGPASASLNPKPRDYTDAAWQASITDDQIKEAIVKGGQALGKSPMMPAQPQLADQPELLNGLVQIIRKFGKPAASQP